MTKGNPRRQPGAAQEDASKRTAQPKKRSAKRGKSGVVAALDYASMGIYVFPAKADKTPRVKWLDESTTDPDTIRSWWARWPKAAIGVDCGKSGLVIVDLDVKDGTDGVAAWREYQADKDVPRTPYKVRTPSGGYHGWYRDPEGQVRNSAGHVAPGVDVRGVGGYVIAPGSTGYRWRSARPRRLGAIPVMPAGVIPDRSSRTNPAFEHWSELDRDALDPRDSKALEALEALGGHSAYQAGGYVAVTRPGKTAGTSASVGHVGPGLVRVFTSNWPPLLGEQVYDADEVEAVADEPESAGRSGWSAEVDLTDALKGKPPPPPTLARWPDGDGGVRALLYPNEVHWVFGEPESMKTWLLLLASMQELEAGHHVLYYDMESNDRAIVDRLRTLGANAEAIRDQFHYFRPDGPITKQDHGRIASMVERYRPTLVVFDGVTDAFAMHNLSTYSPEDVAYWLRNVTRPFLVEPTADYAGPAVVALDHVVKSRDDRNGWAIGSQHKKAGIKGAAYEVRSVSPFGRDRHGISRLMLAKDSPGGVGWVPYGKYRERFAAELHCRSAEDVVEAWLESPMPDEVGVALHEEIPEADQQDFRQLMERVWKYIDSHPSCSTNVVRSKVSGNASAKTRALAVLEEDGYIRNEGSKGRYKWVVANHFSAVKLSAKDGESSDAE